MATENSEKYPSGVSGPRRPTQETTERTTTNAEANRRALDLGISSSTRRGEGNVDMTTNNRGFKLFGRNAKSEVTEEEECKAYQAMSADGSASGVGLVQNPHASAISTQDYKTSPSHVTHPIPEGTLQEPTTSSQHWNSSTNNDGADTDKTGKLLALHTQGYRAPYREGPYDFHHDEEGRLIRKRWYGRMEDGYLAWSSIYLHEYLGFAIYMPLTTEEQEQLKNYTYVPNWMEDLTSLPNLAIPLSYFCIGMAMQLLRTPLIVYFIHDHGASAAEVNVLFTVMALPFCFKIFYGFLSDCVPISGLRRKPYFMTGWLIYIASNFILMIPESPSTGMCITFVFLQTAGYMLSDVMTDALIVERSRFESPDDRGKMQSKGYIVRFFGCTVGAIIGAMVYNKSEGDDAIWQWHLPIRLVFFINGAAPLVFLLPVVPYLLELDTHCTPKNFKEQCRELFNTVQLRAVWQPLAFVYIYNALQLTNAAWMNFLVDGLDFAAWQIGVVMIVGSIMAWFGIMTFEKYVFARTSNWRLVYFGCSALAATIVVAQLILVFGLNRKLGIPDIVFSMGDDVLAEFVIAVQFLQMCTMYLGLCPPGSEGTTYALLTTWSNLAGSMAFDISTALTDVWDVTSDTIAAGDFSGVWKLSLFCGLVGPLPLLLLGLIPTSKEDQRRLLKSTTGNWWAGVIFLSVMVLTLTITCVESVFEVYSHAETGGYAVESEGFVAQRRLHRLATRH